MKLLIWTVLLSTIFFIASAETVTKASEDEPIELTLDNWKTHVSNGIWWVKFFSPYCHHCKAFAPTWIELYKEFKDNKDVNLASVNCVTQGDLCNQEDIMAYPAIHLYNDAKVIDTQRSNKRDYFKKYITDKISEIKGQSKSDEKPVDGEKIEEKKDDEKKDDEQKADNDKTATPTGKFPKYQESSTIEIALKELKAAALELQRLEKREGHEELEEQRKKKQLKIDEAKDKGDKNAEEEAGKIRIELTKRQKIGIVWIDGIFWERWVKERYGNNEGYKSRIVINDEAAGQFWDRNWGHGIMLPSRAQIIETIEEIYSKNPRVKATRMHGKVGILAKQGRNYILEHLMLTTLSFLAVVLMVVTFRRRIMGGISTLLRERGGSSFEGLLGKQD
ncbi:hypothetical protein D0Z03_001199 [Geotrichum reessii]|nr:hypothetical protein D0Z03_001199 [Galactomyces reessii]